MSAVDTSRGGAFVGLNRNRPGLGLRPPVLRRKKRAPRFGGKSGHDVSDQPRDEKGQFSETEGGGSGGGETASFARQSGEGGQDWLDRLNEIEPERPFPEEYHDGAEDVDYIRDRADWEPKQAAWEESAGQARALIEREDEEEAAREEEAERQAEREELRQERAAWEKRQAARDKKRVALEAKLEALQAQLYDLDEEDTDDAEPERPDE